MRGHVWYNARVYPCFARREPESGILAAMPGDIFSAPAAQRTETGVGPHGREKRLCCGMLKCTAASARIVGSALNLRQAPTKSAISAL